MGELTGVKGISRQLPFLHEGLLFSSVIFFLLLSLFEFFLEFFQLSIIVLQSVLVNHLATTLSDDRIGFA